MITVRQGTVDEILELTSKIDAFKDPHPKEEYLRRFLSPHLILIAEAEGKLAGFKCGYEREKGSGAFYSWMGGVLPAFRRMGVATKLLEQMELWASKNGYDTLEFKTLNEHRSMLIFALSSGFDIIGVTDSPKDTRKRILLSKKLI